MYKPVPWDLVMSISTMPGPTVAYRPGPFPVQVPNPIYPPRWVRDASGAYAVSKMPKPEPVPEPMPPLGEILRQRLLTILGIKIAFALDRAVVRLDGYRFCLSGSHRDAVLTYVAACPDCQGDIAVPILTAADMGWRISGEPDAIPRHQICPRTEEEREAFLPEYL